MLCRLECVGESAVHVRVMLLPPFHDLISLNEIILEVPFGGTAATALMALASCYPSVQQYLERYRGVELGAVVSVSVNGRLVDLNEPLSDNDVLAFFGPLEGGDGRQIQIAG